jgi:hypothetical protein
MPNNGVAIGGKPASDRNMAAATTSTGDFNAAGDLSGAAIIGVTVQNEKHETVGKVPAGIKQLPTLRPINARAEP